MATTFTIDRQVEVANDEFITVSEHYKSTFRTGVFEVTKLDEESNTYISVCSQPWNPTGDGQRPAWDSEAEAVEWFKQSN